MRWLGLMLLLAHAAPDTAARTDPATWSSFGWEELRWGMGPGDALARMNLVPVGLFDPMDPSDAEGFTIMAATRVGLALIFVSGGRLGAVTIAPVTSPPCPSWVKHWLAVAKADLERTYGKNSVDNLCSWCASDASAFVTLATGSACRIGITYTDPLKLAHYDDETIFKILRVIAPPP